MANKSTFMQEYLGTFPEPSPTERAAERLWCHYFLSTDAFDERVFTGPRGRDGRLPANLAEQAAGARFAANAVQLVREQAARLGIDDETLKRARQRAFFWPAETRLACINNAANHSATRLLVDPYLGY